MCSSQLSYLAVFNCVEGAAPKKTAQLLYYRVQSDVKQDCLIWLKEDCGDDKMGLYGGEGSSCQRTMKEVGYAGCMPAVCGDRSDK